MHFFFLGIGAVEASAEVTITATGSISTATQASYLASASLTSTATINVLVDKQQYTSADIVSSSTMTTVGTSNLAGQCDFNGTAIIDGSGNIILRPFVSLVASATLEATPVNEAGINSTLLGTASLSGDYTAEYSGKADLLTDSSILAAPRSRFSLSCDLLHEAAIFVDGLSVAVFASANITSNASIIANPLLEQPSEITLAASANILAVSAVTLYVGSSVNSSSSVNVNCAVHYVVSASLTHATTLNVTATKTFTVSCNLSSNSDASWSVTTTKHAVCTLRSRAFFNTSLTVVADPFVSVSLLGSSSVLALAVTCAKVDVDGVLCSADCNDNLLGLQLPAYKNRQQGKAIYLESKALVPAVTVCKQDLWQSCETFNATNREHVKNADLFKRRCKSNRKRITFWQN